MFYCLSKGVPRFVNTFINGDTDSTQISEGMTIVHSFSGFTHILCRITEYS